MLNIFYKKQKKKKVFVGLSGGVDSSVAALLLKQQGYDVTGVYIKGYQPEWIECTWKDDRISAMRTAAHLDIPFLTLDGEEAYKQNVVEYILSEYEKGNTPNGDMLCNREIKFGIFLRFALENGADYIATGHYAKIVNGKLYEPFDMEKDQTYFLSQLTSLELSKTLFPLNGLQKSQVREMARKYNLPVSNRPDSQGICFVGDMSMSEFLQRELSPKKGDVLDEQENVIGQHDGAMLYTIGQRHGFTILQNTENQKNLYVYKKDMENNTIYVKAKISSSVELENTSLCQIKLRNVSFVNDIPRVGDRLDVRLRYRGSKISVIAKELRSENVVLEIENIDKNSKINTEVADGQFCVMYRNGECLGGGIAYQANL